MIEIHALRHGPVKSKGICYGQIDVETVDSALAAIGQIQGCLNALPTFDAVWTSPLERCRMLADGYGAPYRVEPRLMEVSFGTWEGMSWSEIYETYPQEMDAWGADWFGVAPPGGESAQMLQARVSDWVRTLSGGRHLVFTHAGIIRSLRVLCRGVQWTAVMEQPVPFLTLESFTLHK